MNSTKNTKTTRILRFIPMILVMVGIFLFSAMQGEQSGDTSAGLLDAFIKLFGSVTGELSKNTYDFLHHIIRKGAHFTEYALLGASACYALAVPKYKSGVIRQLIWPWLIATLYAVTDEFHQYFVPNRCGTWTDVVIDSLGAVTGILIYSLIALKHMKKVNARGN